MLRFMATVKKEEKFYVAQCLEVDVVSQGESVEAALENLREAVELRLEDEPMDEQPRGVFIAPLDVEVPARGPRR
jgi:predicted RNase H-like HicB family nuclease